ncbi:MAG: short-chain dehydrogenase [Deltaproteobacteria bacterium]|jgi:NAD(P)-dependent dehydrogenase (short-subunit alcohol dehydrogenase family)|nr:short-chain dehydrogenase [Deltaproteobacteria bacterium]
MSDEIRYDGRVAVITGAGGGLGKTYALELARRGAQVVVNDLGGAADGTGGGSSMADQVVKEISEAGGTAVANYDSVATPEGGEAIIQTALDNFEKVDIVINNAGILRDASFAKLEPQNLEIVIDVHLKGAFFVSQPAFRVMKQNGYGRFLFTASAAGIFGNFGQTNYGAAKMGLVGLSNVLAIEGAKYDIKSNVIAPVATTRLTKELFGPIADKLDPECVTPLSCFLVSEACQLSHEVFSVGGGRFARIFVGLAPGWSAGLDAKPSIEEVAAHMDQIRDTEGFIVPGSIADEMKALAAMMKE